MKSKNKNVLSLFDGHSGMQLALKRAGIKIDNYFASEVEISSIMITQKRFPETNQLGDVRQINGKDLPPIWLLSAGSPCTNFSLAGKRKGMVTKENIEVTSLSKYLKLKKEGYEFEGQSYLFWEFIRLLKETKPKYFFLENVLMSPKWEKIITKELGVLPIQINSSLVSAQNRERLYWTNIPNISVPEDKNVTISDIIPNAVGGFGKRGVWDDTLKKYVPKPATRKDKKANCVCTGKGNTAMVTLKNGKTRYLTVSEIEMLQTLPKDYTNVEGVSMTERWKSIGNGWTIDVISHLVKPLKKELI